MAEGVLFDLNDTVSTISDVLLDAEEQQQHNNQVKVWLNRLKDAIYDADNLLDDISTEALRREVMTQNKKAKEVRIFFSKSNQLAYGFKMGRKVKAMRDRLDAIAKDRGFHLDERHVETQVVGYGMRETYSFVRDEEVIGRDYDKDKIIKILLNSNVEESVLILPIVGLGGLGKTTLAQLIFNDEKIQNHFEQRLWVCVSNDFEVEVIVMKILECTKNKKPENLEINTMINDFEKQIEGKRYLLVLDDVRNEDPQKWQSLKDLLKGGARGSTILVTTHDINILAKITQTVQPYMLKGLDDEKSWSLFKRFASAKGQDLENSNIKAIGMEIVAKCKGVPLAIRTLGSVLYFKNPEKEWLSFKDNELSKVAQKENNILPTLKLSYDHLPSYLKQYEDIHEKTLHVSFDRTFLSLLGIPVSFFKFIRLLDLHGMGIETIPNSIGKLNHLRYLYLSHNHIRMLPNSITRLHNLQTLRLSRCPIKELPKDINKLVNLRYLEINGCPLTYMPHGLRQLTKLQTLSQFVIGKNSYLAFKHNSGLKEL
ncbi:putative disease resistance protein RGA3 [Quercus lobata]|uniref:putative disease resistance protein RGA3 n=1 Tax=Quercus lobata TaxID=97700 RepID=UPI001248056D|nr:putative disease resistance protein RGA3 [Quercus lobata]